MNNQSQNTSFIFLDLGQNGQCLLSVPAFVAENARVYQAEFDKWLQSSTEHDYWVTAPDGTKALCFDGAEAFVAWLNQYVLQDSEGKAQRIPTLYF